MPQSARNSTQANTHSTFPLGVGARVPKPKKRKTNPHPTQLARCNNNNARMCTPNLLTATVYHSFVFKAVFGVNFPLALPSRGAGHRTEVGTVVRHTSTQLLGEFGVDPYRLSTEATATKFSRCRFSIRPVRVRYKMLQHPFRRQCRPEAEEEGGNEAKLIV